MKVRSPESFARRATRSGLDRPLRSCRRAGQWPGVRREGHYRLRVARSESEVKIAISEELVVHGVLRSEVCVKRLGLHVHGACQCSQREGVDTVDAHHLPGGIEYLPLGCLGEVACRRSRRGSTAVFFGHASTLAERRDTPDTVRTVRCSWKRQRAKKMINLSLGHKEAMGLAETEFVRMGEHLRTLSAEDWRKPTVCELWDVRDMASHVLAMAEAQASRRVSSPMTFE